MLLLAVKPLQMSAEENKHLHNLFITSESLFATCSSICYFHLTVSIMSTSKKITSWDSKRTFLQMLFFPQGRPYARESNKGTTVNLKNFSRKCSFFMNLHIILFMLKSTINMIGSCYVCICVSFRDFKTPILELDVCKKCFQTYWSRGAWPRSFGLTLLLCLWKLFSPYVTEKYF